MLFREKGFCIISMESNIIFSGDIVQTNQFSFCACFLHVTWNYKRIKWYSFVFTCVCETDKRIMIWNFCCPRDRSNQQQTNSKQLFICLANVSYVCYKNVTSNTTHLSISDFLFFLRLCYVLYICHSFKHYQHLTDNVGSRLFTKRKQFFIVILDALTCLWTTDSHTPRT